MRGDLEVRYYLDDDWFAGISYRYLHRGSNVAAYDYFDDLVFVSVGYAPRQRPLYGANTPADVSAAFVPATAGGPYVGLSAGATRKKATKDTKATRAVRNTTSTSNSAP